MRMTYWERVQDVCARLLPVIAAAFIIALAIGVLAGILALFSSGHYALGVLAVVSLLATGIFGIGPFFVDRGGT